MFWFAGRLHNEDTGAAARLVMSHAVAFRVGWIIAACDFADARLFVSLRAILSK